jgi:serpin B
MLAVGSLGANMAQTFGALNRDLVTRCSRSGVHEFRPARTLQIATGLWGEQTFPFAPDYSALLEQHYHSGLRLADFLNAPDAAADEINAWVAQQTRGRIQHIVPAGAINAKTPMVLANAISFYGSWQHPFSPRRTRDDVFWLRDGTAITTPFMDQQTSLPVGRGDGVQTIEFPYNGDFAFTVMLPDDGQFDTIERELSADTLHVAIGHCEITKVRVRLPKFAFEYGVGLVPALTSLGMLDAFSATRADFTGMLMGTPPNPLYLGEVAHKAFISVDELGTEAAAATAVLESLGIEPEPLEVRIDRPFLFAIRDTVTGTLLFLGRVVNPSGEQSAQAGRRNIDVRSNDDELSITNKIRARMHWPRSGAGD